MTRDDVARMAAEKLREYGGPIDSTALVQFYVMGFIDAREICKSHVFTDLSEQIFSMARCLAFTDDQRLEWRDCVAGPVCEALSKIGGVD